MPALERGEGDVAPRGHAEVTNAPLAASHTLARLPRREGAFWLLVALGVPRLLGAAATLALRRYLGPGVAGRFDLAYAPYRLLDNFRSFGIGPALVYEPELSLRLANTAWSINMVSALFVTIIAQLIAHPVALYYNRPGVEILVRLLSVAYLCVSVAAVHFFLLLRRRDFRARAIPAVGQVLVAGCIAVLLAVWGFGVDALVGREIASAAAGAVILWIVVPFRPRPVIAIDLARRLFRYGFWIGAGLAVLFVSQNADVFIAGRMIRRAGDIGFYTTSWNVAFLGAGFGSVMASSMVFPVLSRLQNDLGALGVRLLLSVRQLGAIVLPTSVFLAAAAPVLIVPLLGPKFGGYRSSYPVLSLLALYAGNRTMLSIFFEAYKSVGRPQLLFWYNLVRLMLIVPAMILGAEHGILGLALAYLPLQMFEIPLALVLVRRVIGVRPLAVWYAVRTPLLAAIFMGICTYGAEAVCLHVLGTDDGIALLCAATVAVVTYITGLAVLDVSIFGEAWTAFHEGL